MSRRGFFTALAASHRRSQREAARHYRVSLQVQRMREKESALEYAQYQVQAQQEYLDFIVSLHRDSAYPWDWAQAAHAPPPPATCTRETSAAEALQCYAPTLTERLLGREAARRAELQGAVNAARAQDLTESQERYAQWEWYRQLAQGVLGGDLHAYAAVIEHLAPFEELEQLGANVRAATNEPWYVEAFVSVHNHAVIPREEYKVASGRLSSKDMPKTKYWLYYQDYVCSAALRVGREILALLPVTKAYVHVAATMLDTATGHQRLQTLLSVELERGAMSRINFDQIDPSDAIGLLPHRMKFKKASGFLETAMMEPTASITSNG